MKTAPEAQPAAPDDSVLAPGTVLGKCVIVRELGRGGMGSVYLAHHQSLDIDVAVKVLSPEAARASSAAAGRFAREAKLAARLRHRNLVEVTDSDQDPATGVMYLVMELVDGPSVAALIARGTIDPGRAVRIATDVAQALDAAHRQSVIHRDVKPSNILLAADGTAKLSDLGLAKDVVLSERLTATDDTLGTPLYMSPEQIRRSSHIDITSDIYSLGVTLYEMLTATPPYTGNSFYELADAINHAPVPDPRVLKPELDAGLAAVVMTLMAKTPAGRPATPAAVLELLAHCAGGVGTGPVLELARRVHAPAAAPTGPSASSPGASASAPAASTAAPAPHPAAASPRLRATVIACAMVVLGLVGWRLAHGPPGGGRGGRDPRAERSARGDAPPPPPWWRDEWGPCPPVPWGFGYGPPPEWARTPGGKPPPGWQPTPNDDRRRPPPPPDQANDQPPPPGP